MLGLHGQVFVVEGWAAGVDSLRRCQKLSLCLTESVLASSKTDTPLAKAEPVSDGGSRSGTTHLKREKTSCEITDEERSNNM